MRWIKQFLQYTLDILIPRSPVERLTPNGFLEKVDRATPPTLPEHADWASAAYSYRTPTIKRVISALKYKGSTHAAQLLAHGIHPLLLEYLSDTTLFDHTNTVLLIPIPLSKKRLRQRGYNQALLLAEALARMENTTVTLAPNALVRSKHTLSQTQTKSRQERFENIRGCFAVSDQSAVIGKHIILIDDVITTGATLTEARRTLLASGARSVIALTAAH